MRTSHERDHRVFFDSGYRQEHNMAMNARATDVAETTAGQHDEQQLIPHDVVSRAIDGATPARAWREHLGFTQAEMAERLGVTEAAYARLENVVALSARSRERIATALGTTPGQLNF
jgi:DNA-binding XRE family transcriptional regulator